MSIRWKTMSLSAKIAAAILGIFVLSTLVLFAIRQSLHARNFDGILAALQTSVMELNRQAARDAVLEMESATASALERGDVAQFMNFAKQQTRLKDLRAFSFYGRSGKVELSSDPKRIGTASHDIAQNIAGVDRAVKQTVQGANRTQSASGALSQLAVHLQQLVRQFRV